jgi:FixJ family two-component response regulator
MNWRPENRPCCFFSVIVKLCTWLFFKKKREKMAMLLGEKQTKQISEALNLKLTTVSAYKTRIFDKFQVRNVIELFRKMRSL